MTLQGCRVTSREVETKSWSPRGKEAAVSEARVQAEGLSHRSPPCAPCTQHRARTRGTDPASAGGLLPSATCADHTPPGCPAPAKSPRPSPCPRHKTHTQGSSMSQQQTRPCRESPAGKWGTAGPTSPTRDALGPECPTPGLSDPVSPPLHRWGKRGCHSPTCPQGPTLRGGAKPLQEVLSLGAWGQPAL